MASTFWTHRIKGGVYVADTQETDPALGSGELHGQEFMVYHDMVTKQYYVRRTKEWVHKMKPITHKEASTVYNKLTGD